MHRQIRKSALAVPVLLCCWCLNLSAGYRAGSSSHLGPHPDWPPVDVTGTYEGKVYFRDKTDREYLMFGAAKLEIKKDQSKPDAKALLFVLSNSQGKQIKGQISFSIVPEKNDLGVGYIKPDNDPEIEIRWYRDADRKILKIVRAKGATRLFRFCANLNDKQCMGRVA